MAVRGRAPGLAEELPPYQRLAFKIGLLFVLLIVLMLGASWLAGRLLVHEELVDESLRQDFETTRRVATQLQGLTRQAELLASAVSILAARSPGGPGAVAALVPEMIDGAGARASALGIWPEPAAGAGPETPRSSIYWLRGGDQQLRARYDYNDPQAVPYWREKWYTPARNAAPNRCFWTPAWREPLSKRHVVTCAVAMRGTAGFRGVVTVDVFLDQLSRELERDDHSSSSYSVLADSDNNVLATSASAAPLLRGGDKPSRNLADLALKFPGFNPLALALHERAAQARSSGYDLAAVAALREATRDLSQIEAEDALARLSAQREGEFPAVAPAVIEIREDPVLETAAFASVVRLDQTGWHVMRITSASEGFAGANVLFLRALGLLAAATALALAIAYLIVRRTVTDPLEQLLEGLGRGASLDEALQLSLDARARSEIGQLAHWHNERIRQLGEVTEKTAATQSHLVIESNARRDAQAALARVQERAALTLQAISDAVITTDEHGMVEDMNAAAEHLTGFALKDARGRNFSAVFVARSHGDGSPLPNLAETALQRGTRVEYPNGVVLSGFGGARRSVVVTVSPVRARQNRMIGTVAVFRPHQASAADGTPAPAIRIPLDPLTGLPTRLACDKRLRALIEAARLNPQRHALVLVDIDAFRRVVESGGQPAADRVITQVAELLTGKSAGLGEVFRLVGDEYAIVLEQSDAERARTFAEALGAALVATRIYWESRTFSITASFGVVEFGGEIESPGEILRRADDARAAAKHAGRNTVKVFDPTMNRATAGVDDQVWVRRIRAGLDQNLFHLTTQMVQPAQAHAADGTPFEVFVALEDEEGFWATPASFMPPAERQHLQGEIDRWVVTHALEHLGRNPAILDRIAFASINLSSSTLSDSSTIDALVQLFEKLPDLSPRKLCFEVHEESILDHPHAARALFDTLRTLGCRSAIDHFHATRSAELAVLRQLQTDFIKIDCQEFKGLATDAIEQLMAETTIRLARTLNRRVIVSNLDDPRQLDAWRRLGADYFQGFIIAKPSPVAFALPTTGRQTA